MKQLPTLEGYPNASMSEINALNNLDLIIITENSESNFKTNYKFIYLLHILKIILDFFRILKAEQLKYSPSLSRSTQYNPSSVPNTILSGSKQKIKINQTNNRNSA